ncbi:MAG: hypothetical protein ACM358_02095 [Gemmatimonadota bacterium]
MPVADSILWSPSLGAIQPAAPLMFFTQHTIRKIHDRLAVRPNGLGIGLLAGRRYTDSRSGGQFVVIDGALPLPVLASEDEATEALAKGLGSAAAGIDIVGWYRSHSFSDAALTPSDVAAQSELFGERASIVLVVAAGGEAGGAFRQSSSPTWPVEALPLYEWLSDPAKTDEPRHTTLRWHNYQASEPVSRVGTFVAPAPAPALAPAPEQARVSAQSVLFPDAGAEDDDEFAPYVAPERAAVNKRFLKPAIYIACALGGAVFVAALSAIISAGDASSGSRDAGSNRAGAAGVPGTMAYAVTVLDRRADTLALAVTAFTDRARMLDARQMTCAGLARGLQQVEDNWLAYSIARRETLASFDAERQERDRALYADVRAVERRFERSGCARP